MKDYKGFTLIEVIVILAVISILAAMAIPTALRIFQTTAENTTNDEMVNLKNAMIGDATKIQNGVRTDFGYLGDVGCLPSALQDLLTKPAAVPTYAFNSTAQISLGWNRSYITGTSSGQATAEFTNDQWGNAYIYTPAAGTCPLTATFSSNGPDGIAGNADDISFSPTAGDTTSTVSGFIKDPSGNPVQNATVSINYPGGSAGAGNLKTDATPADSTGRFSFSNIPFGQRSISVTPKLVVTSSRSVASTSDTAICSATSGATPCSYVEFNLVNFTTSSVSVSSVQATYTSVPTASYYRIIWSATNFDFAATGTGVARTFTAQTINVATSALSPFVFIIDNPQKQPPDIVVGKSGQVGTVVKVKLVNFRACTTGAGCSNSSNPVNMAGVPFTVTFNDGSPGSIVQFTPPS